MIRNRHVGAKPPSPWAATPSSSVPSAQVQVGQLIEYTETDRGEMQAITEELLFKIKHGEPGLAQLILRLFKITQIAIARSHAS